jgi:hypothetical protein
MGQAGVMPQLPTPFRAVLGLVATAMDEAKHLPDKAIELPMLAVSTALQMSLRAQQRYTSLAARGDELLNRREATDEPPEWAVFDEPVALDRLNGTDAAIDGESSRGAGPSSTVRSTRRPRAVRSASKTVRRPRNGKPSPFDAIGDD